MSHLVVDVFIESSEYIHWICEGKKVLTPLAVQKE